MTQFSKDNQPANKKGKGERAKILEALKRQGHTENGFYDLLIRRAMDPKDDFAMREVLNRFSPLKKAVMPDVEFAFDTKGTPVSQVSQLLDAVSTGDIPPDVASMLITAVKAAVDIEVNTELKARIEKLEEMLNAQS
tara:strand:- start:16656 stop:17066 length:411 start_codon:yes stop_codon:yes gene_type:complete